MLCPFEWMTVYIIQSTPAEIKRAKKSITLFSLTRMLFSRPKLTDELSLNPDTCGRANSTWILRVDGKIFESARKTLQTQKYRILVDGALKKAPLSLQGTGKGEAPGGDVNLLLLRHHW